MIVCHIICMGIIERHIARFDLDVIESLHAFQSGEGRYVLVTAFGEGIKVFVASVTDYYALKAIGLTLEVTLIAVVVNTIFGIAASWCITRFQFHGKKILSTLIDLPLTISPVIAGLIYILTFGRQSILYEYLRSAGIKMIFAVPGIVVATVFVTFPFISREIIPVLSTLGTDEEEAVRHKKGFGIALGLFLIVCLLLNTMSSCSMMAQSIGSMISGTTYPSDDPELVAVEANYAAKEAALQAEIDNIESSHPGYDEYRYDLDMIGHDPHELAAYLSAVLQGYTRASAQAELERIFAAQYQLTLTEEVEVRYRTETRTDSEGNEYDVEVPYNYYILNVTLTSKPISSVALELLTPDQLEMYQVYRQTLGNKPLIFGGGSADTSDSESLAGVEFVNGTRPGNQAVVDIAKSQVGNVGGQPYWSWYGFNSRVEWCACFVSWCYGQMGLSEPRFAACQSQGIPWFQSHGQWGGRDYANIAPGDAIFFDWDLDGSADHVGIVVGTDGSRVYTVEGNSGDACKIKSYSLTYECIKGYGLMNW